MPTRPKKPCNKPGCRNLTYQAYCEEHKNLLSKEFDKKRGNSSQRGYGHRWRVARKWYLNRNPFCVECKKENRITIATVVDHIERHEGDYEKFWDSSRWQSLCKRHHDSKTGKGE